MNSPCQAIGNGPSIRASETEAKPKSSAEQCAMPNHPSHQALFMAHHETTRLLKAKMDTYLGYLGSDLNHADAPRVGQLVHFKPHASATHRELFTRNAPTRPRSVDGGTETAQLTAL